MRAVEFISKILENKILISRKMQSDFILYMFKPVLVIYFLFLIVFPISAQKTIKLWDDTDITRKHKWSELIVFLPEKPDSSGISVIICPGGSYYWLDIDNEGFSVAKYLNKHGITAFVLKYRTAKRGNNHPAMIEDLERAIKIVTQNATEYGIIPEKVGIMGFSAGGHLAGKYAVYGDMRCAMCDLRNATCEMRLAKCDERDSTIEFEKRKSQIDYLKSNSDFDSHNTQYSIRKSTPYFVAMIYPVVSMEDSICHKKSRRNLLGKNYSDELKQLMSLEKNVNPNMPPVFLLHCTDDKTVDYRNSVVLYNALIENNVKHKFLLIEENGKSGHGFGIKPNGKATGWINDFLSWLNEIQATY